MVASNIICNEHCPPGQTASQYWGDQLLVPLRDMFHTLCAERDIPDCELFLNKRDYPHLKVLSLPYFFFIFLYQSFVEFEVGVF